jgi:hypothetical protein
MKGEGLSTTDLLFKGACLTYKMKPFVKIQTQQSKDRR